MTLSPQQIKSALIEAATIVGTAKREIAAGRLVDIAALEPRISQACAGIGDLARDQRETVKPALAALLDEMSGLTETLAAQHAELKRQLQGNAEHHRATAAYAAKRRHGPTR